jgi:hypothetical protein
MKSKKTYIDIIPEIAQWDVITLQCKDREYGGSWCKRGGVGAAMMIARKWDRLETQIQKFGWDIFAAAAADKRPEGIVDDIRDLRAYLLLVEAQVRCLAQAKSSPKRQKRLKT